MHFAKYIQESLGVTMYKPGDIHNRLGIDPKTLLTWVDKFPEFFSEGAKGAPGNLHRVYSEDDLVLVNTILKLRGERHEFEKIRAQLAAGYRDQELPVSFYEMDGEKAVAVYSQLKEIEAKYEAAVAEIERLREELADERKSSKQEIVTLNREIAVLEYRLEQLRAKPSDHK
jgi:DNA-binding transcriptional MerR regulator